MNGELLAFYILSFIAIGGGIFMLYTKQVVHMVLALVFTFLSIAGLYVLLSAEFVAVVQVLIYSGAVTIVMLFGIMLTKPKGQDHIGNRWRTAIVIGSITVFFFLLYIPLTGLSFGEQAKTLHEQNTEQIGMQLFTKYIIPFELVSIVLLVALVGAIGLAKREDERHE